MGSPRTLAARASCATTAGVRHDARRQALLAAQGAGRVRHGREAILAREVAAVVAHDARAASVRGLPMVVLESRGAGRVVAALAVAERRAADTRALQRCFHHSGLAVRVLAIDFLEAAEQTSAGNGSNEEREHSEDVGYS